MEEAYQRVHDFWNASACGEELYLCGSYDDQTRTRYRLEPYILQFADFAGSPGNKVLEVGVGLGADHESFARAGAVLYGIDLTERAIEHTQRRLQAQGLKSDLKVANAEHVPFANESFDVFYSWGVLHHSPDTQ